MNQLSHHIEKGTPAKAAASYLQTIKKWVPDEPVIHIDDSDVIKPEGYKFEALGIVLQVLLLKMFIKRDIMLPKTAFLLPVIIQSAYFRGFILPQRRIINQQTQ